MLYQLVRIIYSSKTTSRRKTRYIETHLKSQKKTRDEKFIIKAIRKTQSTNQVKIQSANWNVQISLQNVVFRILKWVGKMHYNISFFFKTELFFIFVDMKIVIPILCLIFFNIIFIYNFQRQNFNALCNFWRD